MVDSLGKRVTGPAIPAKAARAPAATPATPEPAAARTGWTPGAAAARPRPPVMDEAFEQRTLEAQPGKLVPLHPGRADAPLSLSVHGINDSPEIMRPFVDGAVEADQKTLTFCYDDQHSRLTSTSEALAQQLAAEIAAQPDRPLTITAHSMGSRVVLGALADLQERGLLTMPVELRLVSPPLGGYDAANLAVLAPAFIGRLIAGVEPGKDMGTTSQFQQRLEGLTLPAHVTTTIFTGERDDVVDATASGFGLIAENLRAKVVKLPGDHVETVTQAAEWLSR